MYSILNLSEVKQNKELNAIVEELKKWCPEKLDIYDQWTSDMIILKSSTCKWELILRVVLDGNCCHCTLYDDKGDVVRCVTAGIEYYKNWFESMKKETKQYNPLKG